AKRRNLTPLGANITGQNRFLRPNQASRPPGASRNGAETEGISVNFNSLLGGMFMLSCPWMLFILWSFVLGKNLVPNTKHPPAFIYPELRLN
ncbi:hypothetical protein J0667_08850, partial [Methylomonas sp. WH-1]